MHAQPTDASHSRCGSGVKDTVVDAFEELYLKSSSGGSAMDPRQAAQNLVGLAQDASLGMLPRHAPNRILVGHGTSGSF